MALRNYFDSGELRPAFKNNIPYFLSWEDILTLRLVSKTMKEWVDMIYQKYSSLHNIKIILGTGDLFSYWNIFLQVANDLYVWKIENYDVRQIENNNLSIFDAPPLQFTFPEKVAVSSISVCEDDKSSYVTIVGKNGKVYIHNHSESNSYGLLNKFQPAAEMFMPYQLQPAEKIAIIPPDIKIIQAVAIGNLQNILLDDKGKVYFYGDTVFRQFAELAHVKIKRIEGGSGSAFFIDEQGRLYSWGKNHHRQLGLGRVSDFESKAQLVKKLTAEKIKQVACGGTHVAALTESNKLYVWGRNRDGQLGLGSKNNYYEAFPQLVKLAKEIEIKQISVAIESIQFLTADHRLFVAGNCGVISTNTFTKVDQNIKRITNSPFAPYAVLEIENKNNPEPIYLCQRNSSDFVLPLTFFKNKSKELELEKNKLENKDIPKPYV